MGSSCKGAWIQEVKGKEHEIEVSPWMSSKQEEDKKNRNELGYILPKFLTDFNVD